MLQNIKKNGIFVNMIPNINVIQGEVKVFQLIDTRDVLWSPFGLPDNTPMMNPFTWKLVGEWEDGFHLKNNFLMRVENNEVVEMFKLTKTTKEDKVAVESIKELYDNKKKSK